MADGAGICGANCAAALSARLPRQGTAFFQFSTICYQFAFLFFPLKASLCAYVLILMVIYWMFEPINLYVTGAHMTKQPFSLNQINRFFFHYTLFDV